MAVSQDDRVSPLTRAFGHQRKQLRADAGHVPGDQHRMLAADLFQPDPRARQWAFVRDLIASERNASRPVRERRLRGVRCEHDDDVVAGVEERVERSVKERLAIERLDDLRPSEPSGGAAGEQDPRGFAHRMIWRGTARV